MPKQKISREEIISRASEVFRQNGYNKTSMADIAESTGILKGSLYHHFPSKENLMQEVLQSSCDSAKAYFTENAYNKIVPAKKRLKDFLTKGVGGMEMVETGGCLMGNTGLELAGENESFRKSTEVYFSQWLDAVSFMYSENHRKAKARKLAEQALQEFEGAIMLSRVFKGDKYFNETVKRLVKRV